MSKNRISDESLFQHAVPLMGVMGDAFARAFAVYTIEVLKALEGREETRNIGAGEDSKNTASDELLDAPTWVQEAYARAQKGEGNKGLDEKEVRSNIIRNRFSIALKQKAMNQAALARKLRKSGSQVSRILRNPEGSRLKTLKLVADALEVDLSDILRDLDG